MEETLECALLYLHVFACVCVCPLISLPQITGNSPSVCAKSHVAKRERHVKRNRGSLKEGAWEGTGCKTQEVEKDEETRDNEMYKGAEAEEEREGNASREEREEQRREGEEEQWEEQEGPGRVCVCASGTRRRRDSSGQAGRTCVFVFGWRGMWNQESPRWLKLRVGTQPLLRWTRTHTLYSQERLLQTQTDAAYQLSSWCGVQNDAGMITADCFGEMQESRNAQGYSRIPKQDGPSLSLACYLGGSWAAMPSMWHQEVSRRLSWSTDASDSSVTYL